MKNFSFRVNHASFSMSLFAQTQTGKASFYVNKFEGRQTASGEIYSHHKCTPRQENFRFLARKNHSHKPNK